MTTNAWVLVDGEMITAIAMSRRAARELRATGYTGAVRRALITVQ